MANDKVKQIQVGSSTYDIEPANSAGLSSSDITGALGYTPGTYSKPSGGIPSSDVAFNYAGSSSKGGAATSASKLTNTSKIGDTNKPVYFSANGVPVAISYEVNKTVPSTAVFTDTTYTAGTGLTLSGTTFNHTNSITAYTGTPSLMLLQHDAQGHITEDVKVGLSDGLKLSNSNNIVHSNAVTAQATQALYPIKIDSQGHISAYGTAVTSLPASDVYSWAKASTKPTYTYSEVGAASSDIYPNDSGDIKTKNRISLKGYTGSNSTIWYYKLLRLPADNSGNYASAIINGRIGGWVSDNMSSLYCLVWNRNGIGLALLDIGGTGPMSSIFGICDLVVYKNSDNTADVYIKCKQYFTFDFDVELFQSGASFLYDGTYITTEPSGTLGGAASTSTSRLQLEQGVLKVNGTAVSLSTHNHDSVYVKYSAAQTLTTEQKTQARSNIGAGTSSFSGSYNDLSDKPSIPAAQVNSDWNSTTGVSKILNKPTSYTPSSHTHGNINNSGQITVTESTTSNVKHIAVTTDDSGTVKKMAPTLVRSAIGAGTSNFSGNYNDLTNKPTIPAAQIQSDWSQTVTTSLDYIKNKPTSYTPSAHATTTTTYGVGTASSGSGASAVAGQYGHVMLIKGDLNGVTYTDGKAAASSHTHSQYIIGLTSSNVEPVGSITYVASITNTSASASGTTVAVTGIDGGSGGFTPTSKYIRLTGSAGFSSSVTRYAKVVDGTALTSKVDKYLKFTAGTTPVSSSSFSGSATTALVTDLTATVTGSTLELSVVHGTYTPQGSITHTRGTAPGLTSTTTSTGAIAYVESASSGNTGVKFQTCTSASGTYSDATYLTYVQSVSGTGSIKLQTGTSPTTTSSNWTNVGTTGTVFIESATHEHISASVATTATVVTGVTGGTTEASTKYLKGSN